MPLFEIQSRAAQKCELCSAENDLSIFTMEPAEPSFDRSMMLCDTCQTQVLASTDLDSNHLRCLSGSMWSEHIAVQILSWRMLKKLAATEAWALDLLDQVYLDEESLEFAMLLSNEEASDSTAVTKDSNGAILKDGDSVTLIKDLVVKGANFTAKRGTLVKNISLTNNPLHIDGKINGTQIVLVSAFLKKIVE